MKMRTWCFLAALALSATAVNGSEKTADHGAPPPEPSAERPDSHATAAAKAEAPVPADEPDDAHGAPIATKSKPVAAPADIHATATVTKAGSAAQAADVHAAAAAPAAKAEEAPAPSPEDALRMLIEGNERYTSSLVEHPRSDAARRCDTFTNGQHPFASILSCADSRAPVELLFDQGIGDLFVVRVAGNVADTDEIGTLEYGVGHLKSPLIVVLGHTKCGAVTAVANGAKVSENIARLIDNISPAVATARKNLPGAKGDTLIQAAIDANVMQSIADMFTNSEEIRELVASGKVKVVGAVYDIHVGSVRWLGEHPRQSELVSGSLATAKPKAGEELLQKTEPHAPVAAKKVVSDAHADPAEKRPITPTRKPVAEAKAKPAAKDVKDAHAEKPAAAHKKTDEKEDEGEPEKPEHADASADASKPLMPHETGTLKGMLIPSAFVGGATLASGLIFQFMKPRKTATGEPKDSGKSDEAKAAAHA